MQVPCLRDAVRQACRMTAKHCVAEGEFRLATEDRYVKNVNQTPLTISIPDSFGASKHWPQRIPLKK